MRIALHVYGSGSCCVLDSNINVYIYMSRQRKTNVMDDNILGLFTMSFSRSFSRPFRCPFRKDRSISKRTSMFLSSPFRLSISLKIYIAFRTTPTPTDIPTPTTPTTPKIPTTSIQNAPPKVYHREKGKKEKKFMVKAS